MNPRLKHSIALLLCAGATGILASPARSTTEVHVAVNGNDSWSGALAVPNQAGTDGPLATLAAARDAVRSRRGAGEESPVRIVVSGGAYYLSTTLQLGAGDSGSESAPVTYAAADGQHVVLSGGRVVSGWKRSNGVVWQADLSALGLSHLRFSQLYYNGEAQPLARVPNVEPAHPRTGGFTYVVGRVERQSKTKIRYDPAYLDPGRWSRPDKALVDIFSFHNYWNSIVPVRAVDTVDHVLTVADGVSYVVQVGDRFYVKNVFEELDAPGEWYLDDEQGVLYLWPPDGDIAAAEVVVPALETLVEARGDAAGGEYVEHIRFEGLDFAHAAGTALVFRASRHCQITKSIVRDTGYNGINLNEDCHHFRVAGNDITRVGHVGVHMSGAPFDHSRNSHHVITNNHIWNYGTVHKNMGAIGIDGGEHNVVSHNLIHDSPRWAFWLNSGNDNVIEYNHMHHNNLETQDTGAIHTYTNMSGWDPHMDVETNKLSRGNEIRYNLIHDTGGYGKLKVGQWQYPFYCWGIYLDLATSGMHVYGNVVYNTYQGAFMVGGGQDNLCENNIFVNGKLGQIFLHNWGDRFPMARNRIERNVIAYDDPEARLYRPGGWSPATATFDRNLIFTHGQRLDVGVSGVDRDSSWAWWRQQGMDVNSVVADPLFVDAANNDYRLRPESPAYDLGFEPIDLSSVGLYESPERVTWPPTETDLVREEPLTKPPPHDYSGASKPGTRPQLRAPRRGDIVVDGDPGEWPWDDKRLAVVLQQSWDGFPTEAPPSYACAAWDDDALYIAVRNPVASADSLVTGKGWGPSDGLELAFQDVSGESGGPILNVYGFADGAFDSSTEAGASRAQADRLAKALTYAATVGDDSWSCEWRLPWAATGIDPAAIERLQFNIGVRKTGGGGGWVVWEGTGLQNYLVDNAGDVVLAND